MKDIGSKVSNFISAALVGAAFEGVLGPDSHTQNAIESVILGCGLEFVGEKYGSRIPLLNKLYTREYESNMDIVKERLPYATVGWMVGQTIAKYLKQ